MTNYCINSFISSIDNVIQSFSSQPTSFGEIKTLNKEFVGGNISVVMGMVGDYTGTAYLTMDNAVGQNITSLMLGGMVITEVDEVVTSAVGEFCNMIMGGACNELSVQNITVDITPPTVIVGNVVTFNNNMLTMCIPIKSKHFGDIDFDLALIE
jgi:chemotaxis protein CheX